MAERALAAKTTDTKKEISASRVQKAEHSPSAGSPVERILFLQRTIGNRAVQRLMKSGALQARLRNFSHVRVHTDPKAAEKLSIDLALWYVGARFPLKTGELPKGTSIPKAASAGASTAASGGEGGLVFVEIGAGDLKASIELAKKGGVKVIAVDPAAPGASGAGVPKFTSALKVWLVNIYL